MLQTLPPPFPPHKNKLCIEIGNCRSLSRDRPVAKCTQVLPSHKKCFWQNVCQAASRAPCCEGCLPLVNTGLAVTELPSCQLKKKMCLLPIWLSNKIRNCCYWFPAIFEWCDLWFRTSETKHFLKPVVQFIANTHWLPGPGKHYSTQRSTKSIYIRSDYLTAWYESKEDIFNFADKILGECIGTLIQAVQRSFLCPM